MNAPLPNTARDPSALQAELVAALSQIVPDEALLDALCHASRRGVQVRLIVPQRSNHRLADLARERALRELVHAGAQVGLQPQMLHAKAMVVDDDFALCGSLNLDSRSLFINYEAMAVWLDRPEIEALARWFASRATGCRPHDGRAASLPRDVLEGLVRAVGFQL